MKINKEYLEHLLVRGTNIPYYNISISQPTVKDLDEVFMDYDSYKFIYCASKEFIRFEEGESIDDFKNYTYFQTLFKLNNKIYFQMVLLSLVFFLKVKVGNIRIYEKDMKIIIVDDEGKNILFTLDNNNFEEFSELIRLICCCEKMVIKKDEEKIRKYKDIAMQQKYESLIKQLKTNEEKKNKENELTISDIIGAICINENTKYNFETISKLTVWQLYYQFSSMFAKENIEIVKSQFTSGNFKFEKAPDMDWLNKVKIKLPKNNKLIS